MRSGRARFPSPRLKSRAQIARSLLGYLVLGKKFPCMPLKTLAPKESAVTNSQGQLLPLQEAASLDMIKSLEEMKWILKIKLILLHQNQLKFSFSDIGDW